MTTTFLHLPNEVLVIILGNLYLFSEHLDIYGDKADIFSIRLVCKRLAELGTSLAFKSVKFVQHKEGFQRLLEFSRSSFHKYVRRLVCSCCDYSQHLTTNIRIFTNEFNLTNLKKSIREELFQKYCLGRRFQESLEANDLDITNLASAIHQFKRLRSVEIIQDWSPKWYEKLEDAELNNFAASPTIHRLFEAVASALASSEANIEALTLGTRHRDIPPLLGIFHGLSPKKFRLYETAFRSVKILNLRLSWWEPDHNNINFEGISALIRSSPLEELYLKMSTGAALPRSFLHSLELPCLKILKLTRVPFRKPSDLLQFLYKYSATLKIVEFRDLSLEKGSWVTVFTGMRNNLVLDRCSLRPTFWVGTSFEFGKQYRKPGFSHQMISDFVRRKTDVNPFSQL